MKINFQKDILAGFSVFLLALPLCLGIAVASGFPPIAGIISAIVGGLLGLWWGGAKLSIKGPAAGLIVIVLAAVTELGYERTLAIGVIAALIQIVLGVTKKAVIAEIMSPSIIHGMLVAIGIIIVLQQLYVMMGLSPAGEKPLQLLMGLPEVIQQVHPVVLGLGFLSLLIAIVWPFMKKIAVIPSTVIILIVIVPLSLYYKIEPQFLISVPSNILSALIFPDFSAILSLTSLKYILMFALVGSIESLLTVCAIDSMAPQHAPSDLNKDLRAVGVGNLASALLGGLPMISEIVRSKANIDYGATSPFANFSHGVFMLAAVILFPSIINLIPLSALAALLVFVGFRLASYKEFVHVYRIGKDQFLLFSLTLIVTLLSDLLMGIVAGLLFKIILHMSRGNRLIQLFKPNIQVEEKNDAVFLRVSGPLTFLNYLQLKQSIEKMKGRSKQIIIDLDAVTFIDHTVLNKFQTLSHEFKELKIIIQENQQLVHYYNHPLATSKKIHN